MDNEQRCDDDDFDVELWKDSAWIRVHRRCLGRALADDNLWIEEYVSKAGFRAFRYVNDKCETVEWWREIVPAEKDCPTWQPK